MNRVLADRKTIAMLLTPALATYTLLMLAPMLWSLGYTLFTGNPIRGFEFSGLQNFADLFHDPKAKRALAVTVRYGLVVTVGQVTLGYLLSLLYVFYLKRASGVVRTLTFFPIVLPTVAVALLFEKLFEVVPNTGPVNSLIQAFGGEAVNWFGSGAKAFVVIAAMDVWRSMGFYAVLLYAGLVDIPEDVIESARLDGAKGAGLARHIVLPLSWPVLVSALIFSINGTLKVFDSIYALNQGGPGNQNTPLTLYMYQTAFAYGKYGYGATIAVALTAMCLLVTVAIFKTSRKDLTA
ncbi:MAG: sugar ABC transporter permease [Propionibacteriaceae bacterium]|jgi:multiple sugar transport system permease protein/raffinose/stachyose/melibiose transport system permease protein|nr:sugar ABC transporter permease [Propionibacteriaceae bacterium]